MMKKKKKRVLKIGYKCVVVEPILYKGLLFLPPLKI